MSIVLGRVDYRLLHGIVATQWAPQTGAQRIMVIDDKTASDPLIKGSMQMSKPVGMACSIITEEVAINNFKSGKYDNHNVFVVAAKPEIFLHLIESGQKIPELILGLTKTNGVEGVKVSARALVRDTERETYKKILNQGTKVLVKFVPNDKDLKLESAIDL